MLKKRESVSPPTNSSTFWMSDSAHILQGNEVSMDIAGGEQPLPFGYNADTAVDFEGLALLEDHI